MYYYEWKGNDSVDMERAKTILNSPEIIDVLYQGNRVWIDGVQNDNIAQVHYLDKQEQIRVSVDLLMEKGSNY